MKQRTREERRRDRLEVTIGVVGIVGALAFGLIAVLAMTTDVFVVGPTPTPVPTPTETPIPNSLPLPMDVLVFTDPVAYGQSFVVQVATDPGTYCLITASVFSLTAGHYRNLLLADYVTDDTGDCVGTLPIDSSISAGEQAVTVDLRNEGRVNRARWSFQVVP